MNANRPRKHVSYIARDAIVNSTKILHDLADIASESRTGFEVEPQSSFVVF